MKLTPEQREEGRRLVARARQHVKDEREYAKSRERWRREQEERDAKSLKTRGKVTWDESLGDLGEPIEYKHVQLAYGFREDTNGDFVGRMYLDGKPV